MFTSDMPFTFKEYITYKETERFLDSLIFSRPIPHFAPQKSSQPVRKNPLGTERIVSLLDVAGKPHLDNKYIHITGTSGKSSTSYIMSSLLQAQRYRTGLFISPHITTVAEHMQVNGLFPSFGELMVLVERFKPLIDMEYEQNELGMISRFELLVVLALEYFSQQQTDYVVLEVGVGGRYDATNAVESAEVCVITNIGLDHMHILGDSLEEIAQDKIGILKPGSPLVTAEQRPELLAIFRKEAEVFDAEVEVLGRDFHVEAVRAEADRTVFHYHSPAHRYHDVSLSTCGIYQAHNAALAIRSLELISEKNGQEIDEGALRTGLQQVRLPVRYEQVNDDPVVILDGAHNPDKIRSFVSYIQQRFALDEIIFVCGFTTGKKPRKMLASLLEAGRNFFLTRVMTPHRAYEEPYHLKQLLESLNPSAEITIKLDPLQALDVAVEQAREQGKIVCVTGSLYLAGHLRQRWYPEYEMLQQRHLFPEL
ncbi:hypothetical protein CSA56_09590 [candidate division KSB3 bacterium]|uniref:tetrahydrofolate synthase n=1 Tax=candidate division KSB3 bacterium TaxID=2044937 RepID=A0A2G6KE33_9BACT|nr:MAG: hypothetical protein CSA56_09590 [candidate division KSB3 bacterium]